MSGKKKPTKPQKVGIYWPPTGATAQPLEEHLQPWLDRGWRIVEQKTASKGDE